ncbi:MAG TPA: peptidase M19 [Anaerolineae bacterium]|nr:peptidase M19 [Anaerolineae bacterium]
MLIVDGHEDIAWNMLSFDRDYSLPLAEIRERERDTDIPERNGTAMLAWDAWVRGRVGVVFATLFATPVRKQLRPWEKRRYKDAEQAHRLYAQNLDAYHRLLENHPDKFRMLLTHADLQDVVSRWEEKPVRPQLGMVILMEGADGVRNPSELPMWYERGVRIVGPAWMATRYAGGTREPGPYTSEGWDLLEAMADLGMTLDISHLAEEAVLQSLERYPGTIIASHSNPRTLLPNSTFLDRHLTDEAIMGLAERGGVMGIVIGNRFLKDGWRVSDGRAAVTLDDVVMHIDHVCQLVGSAEHVGIGSDLDGGYGLELVPQDLDSVADLRFIGPALRRRGFSQEDAEAVLGGNWLRLLRKILPES